MKKVSEIIFFAGVGSIILCYVPKHKANSPIKRAEEMSL